MEPITTLTGYILSRFLHGVKIFLLITTPSLFLSHHAIAHNIKNKAPTNDEGVASLRGIASLNYESLQLTPENSPRTLAFESGTAATEENSQTSNLQALQKNYERTSLDELAATSNTTQSKPEQDDEIEFASDKLRSYHILLSVQHLTNASDSEMSSFCNYYYDKIYATDVNSFWKAVENKQIVTETDIKNYAQQKINEYVTLFAQFRDIEKNFPSTVSEYAHHNNKAPASICNPACDNIGFENGNLSAWSAYYAQNTSTTGGFSNSTPTGGACGAVQRAAYDPTTFTDQVALMTGPGLDPVAGALIPVVCPTGGSYSCRIGDSTRNGAQVGMLEQTFTVTNANANFTYMYAVVLENPGHSYYQQPYFNVQMLDQFGNPIAHCGNYSVVSGPGLQGYQAIYYPADGDTVYCKPWTTVFVPLQSYIGQCITIQITTSDCALGGHFGYAYFDATCSPGIISSSPAICGNNVTLTAPAGAASYQWIGPCIVGSTTSQTATVSCAGIYKVAVTSITGSGCSDTIVDTVKGSTPPVVTIISHNNVSCNGGTNGNAVAFTTGGSTPYSYSWKPAGGSTANATNLGSGVYTVTVTDANGCTDTASARITEPNPLTITTGAITNVSCNGGNNGSASINVTGGTLPYIYNWSPSGGASSSANNLTAGNYTVTVTDANSCSILTTLTITQPTALASTVSSTNVSCNGGNNGTGSDIISGGTSPYTYTWLPSGGYGSTASGLTANTYTVTAIDAHGCVISSTVSVTEPTALVTSLLSSTNINCFGNNNGSIAIIATGGTPGYTYNWTPSVSTGSSAASLPAGSYTITVTDANGCNSDVHTRLSQPQPLTASTSVQEPTCNGLLNGSASILVIGGTPSYGYTWSTIPPQYTSTANSIGAGTYTVLVTDANGCTMTDTVTVKQPFPLAAAIASTTNPTCYGDSNGSATVNVAGGTLPYAYNWTTTPPQTSYMASGLKAGSYTVSILDANNCPISASTTLTQPAPVTTTATAPDSVCSGTTVTIVANGSGGNGIYSYNWSNWGGSIATQNVTPLVSTTYTVTAVDGNGCKGNPVVVTIGTWNLGPADIQVSPPQTICYGDTVTLFVNVTNSNAGSLNITWSNGFTGSGPFRMVLPTDTTFTVTISNQCGATVKKTITVTVNPLPVISIPVKHGASCYGVEFTYKDSNSANSGDNYFWNFGDGSTGTANPISHNYDQSGSYTVSVVVTSNAGCKASASAIADVTIYPTAKAKFTADPTDAPITNPIITCIDGSTNTNSWVWDFGDGSGSITYTTEQNPSHKYADTGYYRIHLFTDNVFGCADSTSELVHIDPEFTFYVPNAFSPNGDGLNDIFTGKGIGIIEYDMSIFDRWGMLLYETQDIDKGWDGTVNGGGKIAQEDTYVYVIKLTDIFHKQHSYLGSVTLLK